MEGIPLYDKISYIMQIIEFNLNCISVQAVLRDVLDKFLPDDVHIRSNGRVRGKNDSPPSRIQLILH